nr:hypothetical protein [Tanacetum cinerariifolium]
MFINPFAPPSTSSAKSSSQYMDPSNMYTFYETYQHEFQWSADLYICALFVSNMEPRNFKEAMNDARLVEAMQDELFSLNGLMIFLAYVSHKSFTVFQMDVKTAFLHCSLKEKVYVCQPKTFIDVDHPSHVHKLKKALYGFKYAPRAWCSKLFADLLKSRFEMSMMWEMTYFLGLQVNQSPHGFWFELTGFSDAGCQDTFKSTFEGTQFLGENLFSLAFSRHLGLGISLNWKKCLVIINGNKEIGLKMMVISVLDPSRLHAHIQSSKTHSRHQSRLEESSEIQRYTSTRFDKKELPQRT